MHPARIVHYFMIAALVTGLSGCFEIQTKTTVNTDGTLQREVVMKGDSAEVYRGHAMFPIDSTWTVVRRKTGDTAWTSTATKVFADGAALSEALKGEEGKTLRIRVASAKRFLWFTTEFSYSETLLCINQFNAVPISKYFTAQELEFCFRQNIEPHKQHFRSPEDSLANEKIERLMPEWDSRNKFETYFSLFLDGVKSLGNSGLTTAQALDAKESLYVQSAQSLQMGSARVDTLPRIFEAVLGSSLVLKAIAANPAGFESFARRVKFEKKVLETPYNQANLVMPGLVTATNADSIAGNNLSWSSFLPKSQLGDYTMWANSRVINWWAVVTTGAVVILLAGMLLVRVTRRRRGKGV